MDKKLVTFIWNLVRYTIPEDTDKFTILLPNGIVLEFEGFLETCPPQLKELKELGFTVMIQPHNDLQKVATFLNAVLASELGYCPDHPKEHGNYCSECGKRISSPPVFSPIKPFPLQSHSL